MNQLLVPIRELQIGVLLDLDGDSELDPVSEDFVFYESFAEVTDIYVPTVDEEDQRIVLSIKTNVNSLTYRLDGNHLVKIAEGSGGDHYLDKHHHHPFDHRANND